MNNLINKDNFNATLRVKQVLFDYNKYMHNFGKYTSDPQYVILEDQDKDVHAIVKLFNGPAGNLILFNEYVCYQLAKEIDMPMPESGICLIDKKTKIGPNDQIKKENFGFSFYSKYISTTKINSCEVQNISNLETIIKIMLFDHIVFNPDRNDENILVRRKNNTYELLVIDHTHVFGDGPYWDFEKLNEKINGNDYNSDFILFNNNKVYEIYYKYIDINRVKFEEEAEFIKRHITEEKIHNAIRNCPDIWKPQKPDLDALIEYLMYRIDHINEIITLIISYICDKKIKT